MTLSIDDFKAKPALYAAPVKVAALLECDPMGLRWQARNDPSKLPFSCLCIGNRVKFPRAEIVRYYETLLVQGRI